MITCTTDGITFSTTDAISGNWIEGNEDSLVTVGVGSGNGIGVAVGAAVLVQPMQKATRRKK